MVMMVAVVVVVVAQTNLNAWKEAVDNDAWPFAPMGIAEPTVAAEFVLAIKVRFVIRTSVVCQIAKVVAMMVVVESVHLVHQVRFVLPRDIVVCRIVRTKAGDRNVIRTTVAAEYAAAIAVNFVTMDCVCN